MADSLFIKMLKRPSLRLLAANTAVTWIAGLIAPGKLSFALVGCCWLAFGLLVWIRLIKAGHFKIAALPVFFVIAIGIGVSLPAETMAALLNPLNGILRSVNCPLTAGKVGHVFCFGMLTLFGLAIRHRLGIRAKELVAFVFLMAIASEGIQMFIPIRTTSFYDLLFDLTGAVIGFSMFAIYKQIRKTGRSKSETGARGKWFQSSWGRQASGV